MSFRRMKRNGPTQLNRPSMFIGTSRPHRPRPHRPDSINPPTHKLSVLPCFYCMRCSPKTSPVAETRKNHKESLVFFPDMAHHRFPPVLIPGPACASSAESARGQPIDLTTLLGAQESANGLRTCQASSVERGRYERNKGHYERSKKLRT